MAKESFAGFQSALFKFLTDLARNNNRDWFQENKSRYEESVREPSLQFVRAFASKLSKIAPCFCAIDKRVGGSLMRIHRDTRFSKNKQPYKTNVGIHFRHELGSDVHAPGYYVHLEPGECFLGAGIWHPESDALNKIRAAIDADGALWKRVRDGKKFREVFVLEGDSLKTAPRGFAKDHAYIDDLRRKDFIGVKRYTQKAALKKSFIDDVAGSFTAAKPFMRFLCDAMRVPF